MLRAIPGNITLRSNWPAWAAIATDTSLPITWKQIMLRHSARDGLTFPGMIEEPAWTGGINISSNPALGREAINHKSFAILISSKERLRRADEQLAMSNLL